MLVPPAYSAAVGLPVRKAGSSPTSGCGAPAGSAAAFSTRPAAPDGGGPAIAVTARQLLPLTLRLAFGLGGGRLAALCFASAATAARRGLAYCFHGSAALLLWLLLRKAAARAAAAARAGKAVVDRDEIVVVIVLIAPPCGWPNWSRG
jgi:hypothetical protein